MSRKPRSDSKLDAPSEEQHVTLAEWLTIENVSYADAKARVLDQFGVSTSVAALQSFFSRFAAPWKYARAAGEADSFADLMEGKFDAATIKKAKQLAFDAMSGPRPDLKAAAQATDFGGLFLGLSFFLIAAALLLMTLIFRFNVEARASEMFRQ